MVDGVGRRADRGHGNAGAVSELRTLQPALGAVDRAATGAFTAARSLGGASVDGQIGQVQADHPVVGVHAGQPQPIEDAQPDPFVPAAAHRGR